MVDTLRFLIYLAEKGALSVPSHVTTVGVAAALGVSQQTASRQLSLLEQKGFLKRVPSMRGLSVALTAEGIAELRRIHDSLSGIFSPCPMIRGRLVDGIREAAWYVRRYAPRIKGLLGFEPFPGTLNLKVDAKKAASLLATREPLRVRGFTCGSRTFGGVSLYPAVVSGETAAVLHPDRSRYGPEIIEVISPLNLRKKLSLGTGSFVEVVLK